MIILTLFYCFSAILIVAAICVIISKNPVYAACSLVLCFFTAAMIWMLISAEFLAIMLVLIYIGAVMVLLLFVVMMLNIHFKTHCETIPRTFGSYISIAAIVSSVMLAEMLLVLTSRFSKTNSVSLIVPVPVKTLGRLIYTQYFLAFQLSAVMLLVGMIAAIGLTLRKRKNVHRQDPAKQIAQKASDRIRLVSMQPESVTNERQ